MSKRVLILIFTILVLITLSEIGYYFYVYVKYGFRKEPLKSPSKNEVVLDILSPTPTNRRRPPFLISSSSETPLVSKEQFDYVYDEYLPNIAMLKKSNNMQLALVQKEFGWVGENFFDQGWLHIKIIDEKGGEVITYRTSEPNIKYLKFYKLVKGIKTPITYEDIKKGDKITHTNYQVISNPVENYNEYLIE